jgi:predicted aminopeptidase
MFSLSKYPVYYNDYDYQNKKDKDVATCGRWATAFLIHFKKYGGDLKSFNKVVKEGDKKTPGGLDDYICEVITE